MSFTLKETKLWRQVEGTAIALPLLKAKKDNSEDWIKKIYIQQEKIVKFEDNAHKAIAKIGKMCTYIIQKEFFSVKTSGKWTPKYVWDHLKTWYTL